tara:strand:- start:454 stop:711 length:258 start_codon:yes stop_codon:yes gene_type:complete
MKGTRLKDVIGNKDWNKEKWDMLFGKLKKLGTAIEMAKGPGMSIDDMEYRWVNDRIEYYESEDRLLTKEEMQIANVYWKKYGTKA